MEPKENMLLPHAVHLKTRNSQLIKTVHDGVSIAECIAYCFILCLLATVGFNWLLNTQRALKKQSSISNINLNKYSAKDCFIREIRQAPSNKNLWKKISPHEIIWSHNDYDIGWIFEKGKLMRYEGLYSQTDDQWEKRTKSLVSATIKSMSIQLITETKFKSEWITRAIVTCDEDAFNVCLRNGVIR